MSNKLICNRGTVEVVSGDNVVYVSLGHEEACSGCAASFLCSKRQSLRVVTDQASQFKPGDKVEIFTNHAMRWRAIIVCFLLPIVVMYLVAVACSVAGCSDEMVAIAALASFVGLLVVFYSFRNRLSKKWDIRKIDE